MCHLAPYGKNVLKKNKTELTEFFHSRKLAVDFLHFKVDNIIDNFFSLKIFILESCWSQLQEVL